MSAHFRTSLSWADSLWILLLCQTTCSTLTLQHLKKFPADTTEVARSCRLSKHIKVQNPNASLCQPLEGVRGLTRPLFPAPLYAATLHRTTPGLAVPPAEMSLPFHMFLTLSRQWLLRPRHCPASRVLSASLHRLCPEPPVCPSSGTLNRPPDISVSCGPPAAPDLTCLG